MTVVRALVVMLLAIMLAACDSGRDTPRKPASPPQAAPVAAEAPQPPPPPAPLPAPSREVAPRPQAKTVPAPPAHPPRPQVKPAREPTEASLRAPVEPEVPLDLSLPKELAQGLGLPRDKVAAVQDRQALLPPLFELRDKEQQAPGSFEIGGRLITNERPAPGKDYWNTVEGAEVQLHFRQ